MAQANLATLSPEGRALVQEYIWRWGCRHTLPYGANKSDPANVFAERARIANQNPYNIDDADCLCAVCPKMK